MLKRIVNRLIKFIVERQNDGLVNQEASATTTYARHVNQFGANKLMTFAIY
jgi:hypothetical protein